MRLQRPKTTYFKYYPRDELGYRRSWGYVSGGINLNKFGYIPGCAIIISEEEYNSKPKRKVQYVQNNSLNFEDYVYLDDVLSVVRKYPLLEERLQELLNGN